MVIRLPESGSKIACKYISTPLLLHIPEIEGDGVKFDIRYVLLLRSIRPLRLYVHRIFWLRFANKPFSLKELDDYETHFTVMNYRTNAHLRQMDCETFISMYNEQHSQHGETWSVIEQCIFEMFRELFHCATVEEPPLGIGSCVSSRAVYAADIMLELNNNNHKIQPKLLEINFTPDCSRACSYYPNFYNQVFNALFRDLIDDQDIFDISI
jgi:tubulin--tyrosine ligase-like protein 12